MAKIKSSGTYNQCGAATEVDVPPACALQQSHSNEKPAHGNEEQPPLAETLRESPQAAMKTQCSQKKKRKVGEEVDIRISYTLLVGV